MKTRGKRVWFITGISTGLGRALIQSVVKHGDYGIGTLRNQGEVDLFNASHQGKAEALKMDLTNVQDIHRAVDYIKTNYSQVDVLVNNAGFGFAGAIEESTIEEIRQVFEGNFFGMVQLTQGFLPLFRKKRAGHIIQISSHGGIKAFAGFGIYNSCKFALEGFSESLAAEVAPIGIRVSIIEPGPFRTNFAGGSLHEARRILSDYQSTAGLFRERIKQINGNQEGDPTKAAIAIIKFSENEKSCLRLPLGKIAVSSIRSKIESLSQDIEANISIAEGSVFNT